MATEKVPYDNEFRWTNITAGTSLNDITTPGVYRVWGAFNDAWTTSSIYGSLVVLGNLSSNNSVIQIYCASNTSDVYFRGYRSSQWYPWQRIMREHDTMSFQAGDSYPATNGANSTFYMFGWITGALKSLQGEIFLPKACPSSVTPTFSLDGKIVVRGVSGYANDSGGVTPDRIVVTRRNDYILTVEFQFDTALTNINNNTPIGMYLTGVFNFT